MTRINVGIAPLELCDQMLLAELRELPRCYSHRTDAGPAEFTLGKGHVLWCSRHQTSLAFRHMDLWMESVFRGFQVAPLRTDEKNAGRWEAIVTVRARPMLIERIALRVSQMVRAPKWTKRARPDWCPAEDSACVP